MAQKNRKNNGSSRGNLDTIPARTRLEPGQILSQLAWVILVALAAIILINYTGKWIESIQKQSEMSICQSTIKIFSTADDKTIGILKPKLNCPAPHIEISSDTEGTKRKISDIIRTCWAKTLGRNNKLAGTEQSKVLDYLGLSSGESFCMLCSSFTVETAVPMDDMIKFMDTQSPTSEVLTYRELIDTSWTETKESSTSKMFYNLQKEGIVPLPAPDTKMDGAIPLRMISPGVTYYVTDYNKNKDNTIIVTSQSDASNIACDRYLQQRESGTYIRTKMN